MFKVIAIATFVTTLSFPALAETVCGERDKFLDHLSRSYSEAPAAIGLVSNGSVLEVLTSKDGSWTIIMTRPSGRSCVMAEGEAWEDLPTHVLDPAA